jgi:alkanesulfonate monooxygenase SsuD/methylene tetrahydromethanopterin reductase-like flavin-dependent oxidoreductase (luciferase family)
VSAIPSDERAEHLNLAVALDGAGWHPAAWSEPDARPDELFTARYWADLAAEAEHGQLDFLTIEDSFSLRPDTASERTDRVRGRLDAVLIAARIAPLTRHIGLVPTVIVTHTEPFHVSKAIATLDYVSTGRAGVRVRVSTSPVEAALIGRRTFPAAAVDDAFDEATEYVEVLRRLWDSWEDDAEIRDAATGRFIDRDKLHYIDFVGRHFSVKGPSITPRPPQGQPIVSALGHRAGPYQFITHSTDLGYITPPDATVARSTVELIRAGSPLGRAPLVFADLVVFLDDDTATATARRERLDERAGREYRSDAHVFTGTPVDLADLLVDWHRAGLAGFRLRPGALPHDLTAITRRLVPELQRRGAFRTAYEAGTLRDRLGLARPANRYAAVEGAGS